jgi:hypothetical protein
MPVRKREQDSKKSKKKKRGEDNQLICLLLKVEGKINNYQHKQLICILFVLLRSITIQIPKKGGYYNLIYRLQRTKPYKEPVEYTSSFLVY